MLYTSTYEPDEMMTTYQVSEEARIKNEEIIQVHDAVVTEEAEKEQAINGMIRNIGLIPSGASGYYVWTRIIAPTDPPCSVSPLWKLSEWKKKKSSINNNNNNNKTMIVDV